MHDVGGLLMWLVIGSTFCVVAWEGRGAMNFDTPSFDNLDGWTIANSREAEREGWNIWDCDGSVRGRYQLCKYDEQDAFDCDIRVWLFVWNKAEEKSLLHLRALRFIGRNNPDEYERIARRNGALSTATECSQFGSNLIA